MKKNGVRSKFLQAVIFIFFFLCFSPQFSYATAPKSVDLIYDMSTQTLSVTINHPTLFASIHHIKYVEIKKNGATISKNKYGTQPTNSIFTYTYNIAAENGDVFDVTASCNLWGKKTSTLVVVAPAPVVETPAAPKEAVVAPAPVAETPAAPKEAVVAAAPVAEKPQLEKITITLNVKFDTAKTVVKKKYHNDIKRVADFMKAYPATTAVIEGYTDNVDKFNNPENNIKLSQARADNVRQYLVDNFGIDASRITAVGYGPDKPIASNDTKKGRQKNRRVQAVIETMQTK
jgi:outer membrane protein OmpA-like peptidoglycan-associated protein